MACSCDIASNSLPGVDEQAVSLTCPSSVGGAVMGVCGLEALLHLLQQIRHLVVHLLLERSTDLHIGFKPLNFYSDQAVA